MYWFGDTTWHIADPLFYYLSMWLPLLTAYYAFLRRKDTMLMREIVYGAVLIFYTFVLFTGKGVLFGLIVLPMLMTAIAYADLKFATFVSILYVFLNGLNVFWNYLTSDDRADVIDRLVVFLVVGVTALFMNICAHVVKRRQERRTAETNKERDRFKAIVSVGVAKIFEYDINNDMAMFVDSSSGEYGTEQYICNFASIAKQKRYVMFADWFKFDEILQEIKSGATIIDKELRVRESRDEYRWYKIRGRVIYDEEGHAEKAIGSMEDIDDEKKLEYRRADEKMRDPLTKLYMKPYINDKIDALLKSESDEKIMGFFYIDVDDFSRINDEMGAAFGDEILKNIAEDISDLFYETDLFGRVGNDEFVVLMRDVPNKKDIEKKVKDIRKVTSETYVGENNKLGCTVSIGVSTYPYDGVTYKELFANANKALQLALSKGSIHYDIYNPLKENTYATLAYEHAVPAKKNGYDFEFSNYGMESLAELAFKLIDESKDTDSAINLLIRQIVRQMGIDAVVIKEKTADNTLTILYEYGMENSVSGGVGSEIEYNRKQWDDFESNYKFSNGILAISSPQDIVGDSEMTFMLALGIESYVSVAYYDKGDFCGTMDFIDFNRERMWNETDKNTFKTITNVVSSYLLKMKAYETASETVERLTGYDVVTGLYKYEKFLALAGDYIADAPHGNYAMVYTDIGNFKYLNDTYGYEKGDQVLKEMADTIVGYDKYVIVASRVFSDNMITLVKLGDADEDALKRLLEKAGIKFSEKIHKQYVNSRLDVRIGVCTFTISGAPVPIKNIISNANMARKRTKLPGMPRCIFYDEKMGFEAKNEIDYANDMETAFKNKEFVVYMQPKINLKTNKIEGAEALVRWKKNDGNIIYPNDFIPVFEKNKSVTQLDFFVYEEVCRYIRQRLDENLPIVSISVNVSRVHLYAIDEIIDFVKGLLTRYNIPPQYLEFELTETSFTDKVDDTIMLMTRLRKLGVKVSMDDFGSGYSSLNVLTKLPLDILKLDKGFMNDFNNDSEEKIVIPSVIEMAKKLGLDVVCEGVESREQVDFLQKIGCDYAQGFYYSKPVPNDDFMEMLTEQSA